MKKITKISTFYLISMFAFVNKVSALNIKFNRTPTSELNVGCWVIDPIIIEYVDFFWKIIIIVGPLLYIISCLMDIIKVVSSGDPKMGPTVNKRIMKKTIALIVLMILPIIINFSLSLINQNFGTCV